MAWQLFLLKGFKNRTECLSYKNEMSLPSYTYADLSKRKRFAIVSITIANAE